MNAATPVVLVFLLLAPLAAADPVQDALDATDPVMDAYALVVGELGQLADDVRTMCERVAPVGGRDGVVDIPDQFTERLRNLGTSFQGLPCLKEFHLDPFCANILLPVHRDEGLASTELALLP